MAQEDIYHRFGMLWCSNFYSPTLGRQVTSWKALEDWGLGHVEDIFSEFITTNSFFWKLYLPPNNSRGPSTKRGELTETRARSFVEILPLSSKLR